MSMVVVVINNKEVEAAVVDVNYYIRVNPIHPRVVPTILTTITQTTNNFFKHLQKPRKMSTGKKAMKDQPASLSAHGSCITMGASNPLKWWKIFWAHYYEPSKEDDTSSDEEVSLQSKPDCHWTDNRSGDQKTLVDTLIKFSDNRTDFAITITIFFNTGSINIQGKRMHLETWF